MNRAALFGRASDEWVTPRDLFYALDREFAFDLDAAATGETARLPAWLGPASPLARDALAVRWVDYGRRIFVNPPYSQLRAFVEKAHEAMTDGGLVVVLIPARTDTRAWHTYLWDSVQHDWRPGVRGRFLPGRLRFGGATAGAPFPSAVIVMDKRQGG